FSPNGKTVVTGSEDRTVRFWNAETGEQTNQQNIFPLHRDMWVRSVAYSSDGKKFFCGFWNEGILSCLTCDTTFIQDYISKRIVLGSEDKTVYLKPTFIELKDWRPRAITQVAFSPDGTMVLTLAEVEGSYDTTIYLWSNATGTC